MELTISRRTSTLVPAVELVERKGKGHPDTLSDGLAEHLSTSYARYTRERFGAILYHNFDKVGLLGGQSRVALGEGRLIKPIRVLINGRASDKVGDSVIPLRELLEGWATSFLKNELPLLEVSRDLEIHYNLSSANTPGYPETDFSPKSVQQLLQVQQLLSSDTAAVCTQFPLTSVENAVLAVEKLLTGDGYQHARPWLGSDIKVLACKTGNTVDVTVCVPQIAKYVLSIGDYVGNLHEIRNDVYEALKFHLPAHDISLHINTKDNIDLGELYLTAIGTCIESGDEGLVGRGNRPNGLISVNRAHTGEAACGKHPVYFPGKVYPIAGREIAMRLHSYCHEPIEVWLIAQEGRPLSDPWKAIVFHDSSDLPPRVVQQTLDDVLGNLASLTDAILDNKILLY